MGREVREKSQEECTLAVLATTGVQGLVCTMASSTHRVADPAGSPVFANQIEEPRLSGFFLPAPSSQPLTLSVPILTQASPALGCQCPPQAPGGICASDLLGLQTKELHLPHPGVG